MAEQWGVMFHDGSVSHRWNGRTQRQRAEEELARLHTEFPSDEFRLVYRPGPDLDWQSDPNG